YTAIRVDGPLYKQARFLEWDSKRNLDDVTKEVGENVRRQILKFLRLHQDDGRHINMKRRKIYEEPTNRSRTQMEARITFNNSMLIANGINYTCPPFKEIVRASLESRSFSTPKIHFGRGVEIQDE
ncbi:hypothetical protein PHET_12486, partial [Paragonimus heterotremus]